MGRSLIMFYGYNNWLPDYFIPWFSYYWTSNKDSVARRILEDIIEEYQQENNYSTLIQTGSTCIYNNNHIKEYSEGMICKFIIKELLPDNDTIKLKYKNIDGEGYILKYFDPSTKTYKNITKNNLSSNFVVMCVLIKDNDNMDYLWNVISPIIINDSLKKYTELVPGEGIVIDNEILNTYTISLNNNFVNKINNINKVDGNPSFKSKEGLTLSEEIVDDTRVITYGINKDISDKINNISNKYVPVERSIIAGNGLTGGGNLNNDVILEFDTKYTTSVPIGTVIGFAAPIAPDSKTGWLLCDGVKYKESLYPDLFQIIGRMYGGDSSLRTFAVPDLRRSPSNPKTDLDNIINIIKAK